MFRLSVLLGAASLASVLTVGGRASEPPVVPAEPLLLDVNGDGFRLTSARDGVVFDLDGDGIREDTAWTAADSDDMFVAIDRTLAGAIESGRMLLGGFYRDVNAFATLNELDRNPGLIAHGAGKAGVARPADGRIDEDDILFSRLVFWLDANHNGTSEPSELRSAASIRLQWIATGYEGIAEPDEHGNVFRYRSTAVRTNEYGVPTAHEIRVVRLATK